MGLTFKTPKIKIKLIGYSMYVPITFIFSKSKMGRLKNMSLNGTYSVIWN